MGPPKPDKEAPGLQLTGKGGRSTDTDQQPYALHYTNISTVALEKL